MAVAYFDHNSTTPLDPRVREVMLPWLGERFGNPSSIHSHGQKAREAVEKAREQVARLLDVSPVELVFMGSVTEANNTVLRSWSRLMGEEARFVVSMLEHPSLRAVAEDLDASGTQIEWLLPRDSGVVSAEQFQPLAGSDTTLACLTLANNIIGTIQPVEEVARICRLSGARLFCDATQAAGKIPLSVPDLDVDFLSLGAHKFYGPPGAAALWVRKGLELSPYLRGGSQERRRRAGTMNVPAIVGMGEASELAMAELEQRQEHLVALRDRLEAGLHTIGDITIHGEAVWRLPNTTHVAFHGVDAQSLLIRLDLAGFAVSAGSACSSGSVEPSRVLLAMGVPESEALSSIRISLGADNTQQEVDRFLEVLAAELSTLRKLGAGASA